VKKLAKGLALVGTLAAFAPAAQAADFYTDDDGGGLSPCVAADPCPTIEDSVAAARLTPGGPHTIHVAPGVYLEAILLQAAADAGLTIEGSGSGTDPLYDTIVDVEAGPAIPAGIIADGSLTLRRLHVEVTPFLLEETGDIRGSGVIGNAAGTTLEDVFVGVGDADGDYGVQLRGADGVLDQVTVRVGGTSTGAYSDGADAPGVPALTVRDSDIVAEAGPAALETRAGSDLLLQRSIVQAAPEAEASVRVDGDLTADSSLIAGGLRAVPVYGDATLRGVTLDRGVAGVLDPPTDTGEGLVGSSLTMVNGTGVLQSSIALEEIVNSGDAPLTCTSSNVPNTVQADGPDDGPIACPSGPARPSGNFQTAPAALFVDALSEDWRLKAGSPGIDAGAPGGLVAGESPFDLGGNPRILDGDGDGVPRRDQGAIEAPAKPGPQTPPGGNPKDILAPALTGTGLTNSVFAVGSQPTAKVAARKRKKGTTFRIRLNEPATVRIAIQQRAAGRRAKGRCRKPSRKLRKAKRCTRFVKKGTLTRRNLPAGRTNVKFSGRIGKKALKPGRYRALITATDAAGNRSKPKQLKFRVVRR
jgi:hypothetical protein